LHDGELPMEKYLDLINSSPAITAATYLVGSLVAAFILWLVVSKILARLARKTRTTVDDEIIATLRKPLFLSVLLVGVLMAAAQFTPTEKVKSITEGVIITMIILLWARAGIRISKIILQAFSRNMDKHKFIQPRTLPLFEVTMKTVFVGSAAYCLLMTWNIDVTAWLASAGIVGIAVGFAAKDTLSNFFSGIFIMADAPYKLGDYIVLDSGERGKVTDIGIRSTRIITRDDIQIIVPNATIGNAKIVNETAGPTPKRRVKISVGVAYGTDIDLVREILMDIGNASEYLVASPEPRVRFWQFGESSLDFNLLGWIDEPELMGRATDELNTAIYKRFAEAEIEIPFPQRDVHMKKD